MSGHSKLEALSRIRDAGLVSVFHHSDAETAYNIAEAVSDGGFRAIEFTNRGDHSLEVFASLERRLRVAQPDCVIGLGSVIDAATASVAMNLGADFIVGPALVEEVAVVCNRRQIPYMPGCGTLTEMLRAIELGCDVVKAFPAGSLGGPDFVKAVRAPCPWLQIMPTGGVAATEKNLEAWFDAGVFAVGIGSKLVPASVVEAGDWAQLTEIAREAVGVHLDLTS